MLGPLNETRRKMQLSQSQPKQQRALFNLAVIIVMGHIQRAVSGLSLALILGDEFAMGATGDFGDEPRSPPTPRFSESFSSF